MQSYGLDFIPGADGKLRELALFAGAGGGILGGLLLGWRTVCAVECDGYAAGVLVCRQNEGHLAPFPIWDDVRTFDGAPWRGCVDVVSGGFPCTDISAAGKGAGIDGKESGLWREMARIIGQVRPRFVFVENSPRLTVRGLGRVLGDMAQMGFDCRWGCVSAADSIWLGGDPCLYHERERIWIVAVDPHADGRQQGGRVVEVGGQNWRVFHSAWHGAPESVAVATGLGCGEGRAESARQQGGFDVAQRGGQAAHALRSIEQSGPGGRGVRQGNQKNGHADGGQQSAVGEFCQGYVDAGGSGEAGHADGNGWPEMERQESEGAQSVGAECASVQRGSGERAAYWWSAEPPMGRVVHGLAHRVDRLRAIGNGQVPGVAALAWRILTGQVR